MDNYAGHEWIEQSLKKKCSPLGAAVADLLGRVFLGIYHVDSKALGRVEWDNAHYVSVVLYGDLATVDNNRLTLLVVLAHEAMMRVSLEGCGPKYIRAIFHQRKTREGSICDRCPTIDEHVQIIRQHFGEQSNTSFSGRLPAAGRTSAGNAG